MTSYKADVSVRILVNLRHELADAPKHGMSEQEALRRLIQTWYETNILPIMKDKVANTFGGIEATVFDNAIAKVQLD